ncbi:MAG: MFS transporter [Acidobacteria bacterium]|nr:MFS transporter [Acidobacteriota bacterium]
MAIRIPARWLAIFAFTLYSAVNYLDRQMLAALAPQLQSEFQLSNEDYGWIQSAFSLAYALSAPAAGLFLDRVGLARGASLTIAVWSMAGVGTGLVNSFLGLLGCRVLLGASQSGGIPAFGKASATYLHPQERALGTGVNQVGISLGSMGAPLLAGWMAAQYGWRAAFVSAGALGFLWIPLWRLIASRVPPETAAHAHAATPKDMLRDPRLWSLIAGNVLVMTVYSLWSNWTTIFLVQQHHLTQLEANQRYAWIPPVLASAGGLFGGWMAMKWMAAGASLMQARSRTILLGGAGLLSTLLAPYVAGPAAATAIVSVSFFLSVAASANVYALPQDIYGAGRAAFAVAAITFGFGLMQTFYAPLVGRLVDHYGFPPVCVLTAFLPLAGWLILRVAMRPLS